MAGRPAQMSIHCVAEVCRGLSEGGGGCQGVGHFIWSAAEIDTYGGFRFSVGNGI